MASYRTAIILFVAVLMAFVFSCSQADKTGLAEKKPGAKPAIWTPPDSNAMPAGDAGKMVRYGKELLTHTAEYFGPQGSIAHLSNGMNCQNCHLAGGTRVFGNNYALVAANYPKLSYRSGKLQPISQRIADCFMRSMDGTVPDTNGREVKAMIAYLLWIGQGVKKGQKLYGNATEKLPYLKTVADPVKGQVIYITKCKVCHGERGQGTFAADKRSYTYPPLWGPHSFNDGAGMYRIGNLAGFVKNNMPFGTTYKNPQLSNEDAWNVAAYVCAQPRPHFDAHNDWKDLKNKPIDIPFGPYADTFSEHQHKFGPFGPMKKKG